MHCTSSRSIILWAPKLFFASAASVLECIDICARHRVSICICSELPLESFHSICHWLGMLRHTNADTSHPAAHTQLTTHPDQNYKCKTHYYEVFLFRFRENKLHVTSVEKYCRNVTPVFPGGRLGPTHPQQENSISSLNFLHLSSSCNKSWQDGTTSARDHLDLRSQNPSSGSLTPPALPATLSATSMMRWPHILWWIILGGDVTKMRDRKIRQMKDRRLLSRRTLEETCHVENHLTIWAFLFSFVCTRLRGGVGSVLSLLSISLRNSAESLHKETLPVQNREWNTQLNYAMEHTLPVESLRMFSQ